MNAKALILLLQVVLGSADSLAEPPFKLPVVDDITYRRQEPTNTQTKTNKFTWQQEPAILSAVKRKTERKCLKHGESMLKEKDQFEETMKRENRTLSPNSAAHVHQTQYRRSSARSVEVSKQGFKDDHATASLKESLGLSDQKEIYDLYQLGGSLVRKFCDQSLTREEPKKCNRKLRYRSIDGSCNNIKNPTWGATMMPFRRVAPPDYGDGVMTLRLAKDGSDLPSARLVSTKVNLQPNEQSVSLSIMHMSYGQFLDHDLDFTPVNKAKDGEAIPCCPDAADNHPECAPIAIPEDDPFYSEFLQTCMEFARSAPSSRCSYGPREQMNEHSAYIDGSQIYGTNINMTASLRTMSDGQLITQVTKDGEELLPPLTDVNHECNKKEKMDMNQFCFRSGDSRINEIVLLVLFHTVWTRQHNRIAKELKELNPAWLDEELFQETRRIVGAQLQHVTYNEYLRATLGDFLLDWSGLAPLEGKKQKSGYNSLISAGISNEFATAAFRFGHSQITGHLQSMDESGDISCKETTSFLVNPFIFYTKGTIPRLLQGGVRQNSATVDPFFSKEMAGKLFRGMELFGLDLMALNIQRGRDHGLASYTAVLGACGISGINDFSDLSIVMDDDKIESLQSVYSDVDDIDLFVGGLSERPRWGSIMGPTFTCILLDQFQRMQNGDRFWYETDNKSTRFTKKQLRQLRKTTLASVMCGVIPELKRVQQEPLKMVSLENPLQDCSSFQGIDLSPWKV